MTTNVDKLHEACASEKRSRRDHDLDTTRKSLRNVTTEKKLCVKNLSVVQLYKQVANQGSSRQSAARQKYHPFQKCLCGSWVGLPTNHTSKRRETTRHKTKVPPCAWLLSQIANQRGTTQSARRHECHSACGLDVRLLPSIENQRMPGII